MFRAYDGKEILGRLHKVSPDLLIMDVAMPVINGYEVCKKIRTDKNYERLPIIMITGKGRESRVENLKSGANEFITKPYKLRDLLAILKVMSSIPQV